MKRAGLQGANMVGGDGHFAYQGGEMSKDQERDHDAEERSIPQEEKESEQRLRRRSGTFLPEPVRPKSIYLQRDVTSGGNEESSMRVEAGAGKDDESVHSRSEATGPAASLASAEKGAGTSKVREDEEWPEAGPADSGAGFATAGARPAEQGGGRRRHGPEEFNEEAWATERKIQPWFWLLSGMVCLGFVIFLYGMRHWQPVPAPDPQGGRPEGTRVEVTDDSIPVADFLEKPGDLKEQMSDLIRRFEGGESHAEIFRGGGASAERLKGWRARVPEPAPVHFGLPLELSVMAINDYGFAVLTGTRRDYSSFGMYFVKEAGRMRLDWEASEGFSEVLPGEVTGLIDREPHMMRALLSRADFYTDLYREERFQCYTLQHVDPTVFVWAYAERGSAAHRKLRTRVEREDLWGDQRRVVVMVRRGREGSRPNVLDVVSVLGEGWMIPPKDFWQTSAKTVPQ